ncbi:MAG TPA: hypothetical protein VF584_07860 [Longimicrobium sp.]|jgi:hypothetical protein
MREDDAGDGRRKGAARWWVLAALLLFVTYYARQHILDGRGLVREMLTAPGVPSTGGAIYVSPVVLAHVPLGSSQQTAVSTLMWEGFSVEVFPASLYEWLGYNCADCDRGIWGRYNQSYLTGGQRLAVGIGLRGGRVVHLEAYRAKRIIEVP